MARMELLAGVKGSVVALEPRLFVLCLLFVLVVGVVADLPGAESPAARPIEALRAE